MSDSNKKSTPFTSINSINDKHYQFTDEHNPYITNTYYSNYKDTILLANEMNQYNINKRLSYDFYFYSVKQTKRPYKWNKKPGKDKYIDNLMEYYKINYEDAYQYSQIMSEQQIEELMDNSKNE